MSAGLIGAGEECEGSDAASLVKVIFPSESEKLAELSDISLSASGSIFCPSSDFFRIDFLSSVVLIPFLPKYTN